MCMQNRNYSLDILRIFACIAVIIIHTAGSPIFHKMVLPNTLWYNQCLVMDALSKWSVPVFVMISGYFLIDPKKKIFIKNLFTKYILRLVVSLIIWSIFYSITLHKAILPFGSQEGHFWYLNMLIGLYLSLPILRVIACRVVFLRYFCMVWLVFVCYKFIGNFCSLPLAINSFIFVEYAGYALLGYYIKINNFSKYIRGIIYGLGVLGLIITIFMSLLTQNGINYFNNYFAPNIIMMSIALVLLCNQHPLKLEGKVAIVVEQLSGYTYGIYLVHMWLLIQVFFRLHRYIEAPIPLSILCTIFVFIGGMVITAVIKKIPIINKFIV